MPETTAPTYTLTDLVYQQQDATVFNGAAIPAIAGSAEAFIIFYLSREDEQNGYGTVIQLDSQTKQAAIFADLNPEYSYLFYKDEQGSLQTLLWCIEFATRTNDGLFVTQAKVYGRGITEQELRQMAQQPAQAGQPYQLAEPISPIQAKPAASSLPPTPQPSSPASTPAIPVATDISPMTSPEPAMAPAIEPVVAPSMPSTPIAPATPDYSAGQPDALASTSQSQASPAPAFDLPPLPDMPQPDWPTAPPVDISQNGPAMGQADLLPATPSFDLPPLPQLPSMPTSQPAAAPSPVGDKALNPAATAMTPPPANDSKQPVGRPPKPLIQDRLWMISAEDFTWLKNISREPIEANKELLRQKIINQIRLNQPNLIEDWQFLGKFEQAFSAICLTYNLVPGLRHDLLKSLLNGRVIDGVTKQS